jgi:hypothetical protein
MFDVLHLPARLRKTWHKLIYAAIAAFQVDIAMQNDDRHLSFARSDAAD